MRTVLIWVAAAFVFGNFYSMVAHKEGLLRSGQTVYLQLAPVDPRSLLQGDYMELNYAVTNDLNHHRFDSTDSKQHDSGTIVIQLDEHNVGTFVRYASEKPLGPGEHLLKFHHADWRAVIGAESFFIPEGTGDSFAHATYGELKLEPDGTPLIVALCDKDRNRIAAQHPAANEAGLQGKVR